MLPRQEQPSRAERSTPPYLSRSLCALTFFVLSQMTVRPPLRSERPALVIQARTSMIGCNTMDTMTSPSRFMALF